MCQYDHSMRRRNLRSVIAAELADSAVRPQESGKRGISLLCDPREYLAAFLTKLGVSDLADLSISEFNRIADTAEADRTANIADWEAQLGWDA